jgi:hypothetical protein
MSNLEFIYLVTGTYSLDLCGLDIYTALTDKTASGVFSLAPERLKH